VCCRLKNKTYLASFAQADETSYFHHTGLGTLGFQAGFGIAKLNLCKHRAEFG
jgi:hypothetical protein